MSRVEVAQKLKPLFGPARYKGLHGGRGGQKSWFFATALIIRCCQNKTDWACLREVQKTLDQSVKKLLESTIERLGVGNRFEVQTNKIKTPFGGVIIFQGMQDHTADSIKSLEGFDGAWFEEAQTCSERSLELLRPTIRKPGSEIWFSWNPRNPTDPVDMFFRGDTPPPDSICIETNYTDNKFFPDVLEQERSFDLSISPERHAHVWLGAYDLDGDKVLVPAAWVNSAVDAHIKLKFEPTGAKYAALDVADEGKDKNAYAGRHGVVLQQLVEWTGKGADIFDTVERSFLLCDQYGYKSFDYDADGLGSGVRGDARVINERRDKSHRIKVQPFRGSGEKLHPEREMVPGRKNKDFFENRKAQAWWELRLRFQNTFRAVIEGLPFKQDELISIPADLPGRSKLVKELSQPTWDINGSGKVIINKAPEGTASPNLADAVNMCYAAKNTSLVFTKEFLRGI